MKYESLTCYLSIVKLLNQYQPEMRRFDPTMAAIDVSRSLSVTANFRVPV